MAGIPLAHSSDSLKGRREQVFTDRPPIWLVYHVLPDRPVPADPISVLIVDDHAVVRMALSMYLRAEPGVVVWGTAESGEDALAQLHGLPPPPLPDALVVDVQMPGMSGLSLVADIKARHPDLPCVVFSADSAADNAHQAMAAGAVGYIEKGRPDTVAAAVRAALAPK